jgi:hypothetical protein
MWYLRWIKWNWDRFFSEYRGADKSLVRPDWKKNWKVTIFHPKRRSLLLRRPGWKDKFLNCFWVVYES